VPRWDDPDREDELAQLVHEIDNAERLIAELPSRSRDREFVERTVDVLNARVRLLLGVDEIAPAPVIRA
jgi:hypothetical protein